MNQAKLWTRDFTIVSVLNFLLVLVFYLLVVVIGLYASRDLNATVSQAGLVVGVFIIGSLVGRLMAGQFLDRLGRKRSMLLGLFLAVLTCLLYFIEAGIGFLILVRLLHGIAVGIAATATATVVAHLVPASRRGEGLGYFGASSSLATAIGPFIGMMMMQHTDFDAIMVLCTVTAVACFAVGLMLRVPELDRSQPQIAPVGLSLDRFLELRVMPISMVMLLSGVFYSSVLAYLSAFAVEINLADAASFFFIVYALTVLVTRPASGRLMDLRGANIIMYPGLVVMALGFACLGLAQAGWAILTAAVLLGLGFGSIQICIQAIVIKLVEPARIGLATSTYFICVDAGLGFGPYLLGLIVPSLGYGHLYVTMGALTLLLLALYHMVYGATERKGAGHA